MKHYITLSDSDVLSMDESSGDIVVSIEDFSSNLNIGDEVQISYEEDSENIHHKYIVKEIEGSNISLSWVEQLGESVLTESPIIKLDADDLMNPASIDLHDKAVKAVEKERAENAAAEKTSREAALREKNTSVAEKLSASLKRSDPVEYIVDHVFDDIVPPSGPAETVAGELVRAITRIIYRDSNDGDKFFEGYGIETCGSSAEYLFDNGFEEDIQNILDQAVTLSEDDNKYTDAIQLLTLHILEHIDNNPTLLWTENTEDSREYSYNYIEENQPKYEFEIYGSDDIRILVDKGVLTSWDLIRYVESQLEWESAYRDADVARPWSHYDTSVTVTELTRDGYELLKSNFEHDPEKWWEDLTSEHADELSSDYDDDYSEDGSYEEDE